MASIPDYVRDRDLHVIGQSWPDVLSIDIGTVSSLFARADLDKLRELHRNGDPSDSIDVMVADDRVSLWIGTSRLAVLER